MIKETKHFILDNIDATGFFGGKDYLDEENGLVIKIKNDDKTIADFLYIYPNKDGKFMENPGCHIRIVETSISNADIPEETFKELSDLVKEAKQLIATSIMSRDFDKFMN